MSGSRYERVPQNEDNISLESLGNYNYMTGVPNSPPPSFHSSQSVTGGDDLTPTHTTPSNEPRRAFPPPSVIGSTTDSEAIVINLHKRIEQLEETIGRLLLEKEEAQNGNDDQHKGDNCCVTLSGDPSAAEMAILRRGHNCCMTFAKQNNEQIEKDRRILRAVGLICGILCLIAVWTVLLAWVNRRGACKVPAAAGSTPDAQ